MHLHLSLCTRAPRSPGYIVSRQNPTSQNDTDTPSYVDTEPVLDLFLEAQQYYKQHGIPTKVKSCAFTTTDEMIRTAGVDAMTLPGEQVAELAAMTDPLESLESRSVFLNAAKNTQAPTERLTYINDKAKFMRAYTTNGRGKAKTEDVSCLPPICAWSR